ncbi:MAG: tRNA(Ser) Um(44) 2'-O-methyltransferase [Phylliscum demangeonii]|nr:MAG: tRNA(Ser) Um(44) 2'-O-methyltransferase [Phylliscum demangeonii]
MAAATTASPPPPFDPVNLFLDNNPIESHLQHFITTPSLQWHPILSNLCSFPAAVFEEVMLNLIRNPNLNSGYLFRADILFDDCVGHRAGDEVEDEHGPAHEGRFRSDDREKKEDERPEVTGNATAVVEPMEIQVHGYTRARTIVRKLIPRNPQVDRALLQTCCFFSSDAPVLDVLPEQEPLQGQEQEQRQKQEHEQRPKQHLVIYLPHASCPSEIPFYHPPVQGVAFLHSSTHPHTHTPTISNISIYYAWFTTSPPSPADQPTPDLSPRLSRTARHLLEILHKHGQGTLAGYVKRVQHDTIIPQARYQNTYTALKARHAKRLLANWAEATDGAKHAFEDLGIAAFLTEVWRDMGYRPSGPPLRANGAEDEQTQEFPGFVDLGCGNGVLVDILIREGWTGWGFDARRRKSWSTFTERVQVCLKERILIPAPLLPTATSLPIDCPGLSGLFPAHTFLIANHADELTAWTPLLAALADHTSFLIIPCCSHDFSGAKFRAPRPPRPSSSPSSSSSLSTVSAYAALVHWTTDIAECLGYEVEREWLRIPSTRNAALLGRRRRVAVGEEGGAMSVEEVLRKFVGGGDGGGRAGVGAEEELVRVTREWIERAEALHKKTKEKKTKGAGRH